MHLVGGSILVLFVINILLECFLAPPTLVRGADGIERFVYYPDFGVVVLFIPTGLILLKIIQICLKSYRKETDTEGKVTPVVLGGITLFLGNVAAMLPAFEGIPVDILSGNMNAIFLFYALYNKRLCIAARTDELTGLLSRKYFHKVLEEQSQMYADRVLSLVIINVDDFKLYNQLYGHIEGDMALKHMAQIIRTEVNERGLVARYSGKEFAIILPMWDAAATKVLVQGIRDRILKMNKDMPEYRLKKLTVSCGIGSMEPGDTNTKQLLANIDMAIYHIKRSGKNGVSVYTEGLLREGGQSKNASERTPTAAYTSILYALAATIDAKDHYTFKHSSNVAYYACELGCAYGLPEESIAIINESALLHDIGKIGIAEDILNKPGPLTMEEYTIMKSHVENAVDIIRHLPSLDYVIPAVIGHHERYDGKGYPRQIGGEEIPLVARILCIADSFDAMISRRSYKREMSVEKGVRIIEDELGKQFDPVLGKLFIQLIREGKIEPQIEGETA